MRKRAKIALFICTVALIGAALALSSAAASSPRVTYFWSYWGQTSNGYPLSSTVISYYYGDGNYDRAVTVSRTTRTIAGETYADIIITCPYTVIDSRYDRDVKYTTQTLWVYNAAVPSFLKIEPSVEDDVSIGVSNDGYTYRMAITMPDYGSSQRNTGAKMVNYLSKTAEQGVINTNQIAMICDVQSADRTAQDILDEITPTEEQRLQLEDFENELEYFKYLVDTMPELPINKPTEPLPSLRVSDTVSLNSFLNDCKHGAVYLNNVIISPIMSYSVIEYLVYGLLIVILVILIIRLKTGES